MTAAVNLASLGTAVNADSSGNFQMNSGYGSVATAYGCRAWVNFNGTGTVAIRGSGNVSSISDNGTGSYTVNFTTAMPDANYGANISIKLTTDTNTVAQISSQAAGSTAFILSNPTIANYDSSIVCCSFFR